MNKSFDSIAPARTLITMLRLAGLWHYTKTYWSYINRLYAWQLHTIFIFIILLGMLTNVALSLRDIEQLSDAIYLTFTETGLAVKSLVFLTNLRIVRELFETLANAPEIAPQTPAELKLIVAEFQAFNRLRNGYYLGIVVVLFFADISGYLNWTLPFPCWLPFDYHTTPNFYYAYWYIAIGITFSAITCGTIDLSIAFLLFQVANCYKLLALRLEKLGSTASEDVDMQLKQLLEFNKLIVEITAKCERLISLPVMVQIFMSAFVICFTAYRLNTMNFLEDPSSFMVLLTFGMVMALQIYLPCSYGNELTLSANNLTNAIYKSNWFNLPTHTQKDINIYMEYLKRPVAVRAGNFFAIGLPIFTQVMNNAYRLYAVLVNIGK